MASVKMSINPFCEIAVEEAVRMKENKIAQEVRAGQLSSRFADQPVRRSSPSPSGPSKARRSFVRLWPWELTEVRHAPGGLCASFALRPCLCVFSTRAGIHVSTDLRLDQELQPLSVAKIMAKLTESHSPSAWLLGKQSIDDDSNQVAQMLAALLDWPQAMFASAIKISGDKAEVTREIDGGLQTIEVPLPAVFSADLRLNTPRYTTLPNIMKAKKKPIETIEAASLGVDLTPHFDVLEVSEPPSRSAGVKVADVDELIGKLKDAGAI
jgi:electron transfer flavoprotein beta subunit